MTSQINNTERSELLKVQEDLYKAGADDIRFALAHVEGDSEPLLALSFKMRLGEQIVKYWHVIGQPKNYKGEIDTNVVFGSIDTYYHVIGYRRDENEKPYFVLAAYDLKAEVPFGNRRGIEFERV